MDATGRTKFPYDIIDVSPEESKEINDFYEVEERSDFIRIGPKGFFLTKWYAPDAEDVYNMPIRPSDTFVVSFPKSGTTWTQELVWLLLNNFDYDKAKSTILNERFPFLEISSLFGHGEQVFSLKDNVEEAMKVVAPLNLHQIMEMPSPRFLKSHLPLSLLPPTLLDTSKVIFIARNVRDVIVSFYHHMMLMKMMAPGRDFKQYWKYFITDRYLFAPYFATVLEFWEKRHHPNMLFLFYEELSQDLPSVINRVAAFLGKEVTDEQVAGLCDHLKFDNFKKNKSVNMEKMQEVDVFLKEGGFIRKGKVGGWREYFDEEMKEVTDKWIEENLRNTDFRFPDN